MNIEFKKFSEFQRKIIYELLKDGYSFETNDNGKRNVPTPSAINQRCFLKGGLYRQILLQQWI